ncbi:hypothetical protein GCWU000182_01030 [Abiotrophia defectiva ATCC 49176]|uniref:Uncharacterized protein n=1 Tax=Abiotrophia defectiva ATCC 49176 TaxID=592010 RepID=W1Q358_ABIDE|nr:hypothetical protein GCWU000182_01030 [Abiotrophia defectiva ATCC 49176]
MGFNLSWLDKKEEPYSIESVWFFALLLAHFEIIIFNNAPSIF